MALPVEIPLAAGACDTHVVPFDVSTLPEVLGETVCNADVPLPSKTVFAVKEELPVPPLATGSVPVVNALVDVA